jgi:hypothetical protein
MIFLEFSVIGRHCKMRRIHSFVKIHLLSSSSARNGTVAKFHYIAIYTLGQTEMTLQVVVNLGWQYDSS